MKCVVLVCCVHQRSKVAPIEREVANLHVWVDLTNNRLPDGFHGCFNICATRLIREVRREVLFENRLSATNTDNLLLIRHVPLESLASFFPTYE